MQTAIGVDLGGSHVSAAVVTERRGDPSTARGGPRGPSIRGGHRRARCDDWNGAQRQPETSPGSVSARPATSTPTSGAVLYSPNFGWQNVPLGDALRKKFGLPVFVGNDARCATLGEYTFGTGKGYEGFRAADARHRDRRRDRRATANWPSAINGVRARSATTRFGRDDGFICGCGKIGCFEAQASGTGLIRHAFAVAPSFPRSVLLDVPREKLSSKKIRRAAQAGDRSRARCVEELHRRPRDRLGKYHRVRQSANDRAGRRRFDRRRVHARRGPAASRRPYDHGAEGNDGDRGRIARKRRGASRGRHDGAARWFDDRGAALRYRVLFFAILLALTALPGRSQSGDPIHRIRHVVIIMQENRSFDSYFGTFPGCGRHSDARRPADGLRARIPQQGNCVRPFHDARRSQRWGAP